MVSKISIAPIACGYDVVLLISMVSTISIAPIACGYDVAIDINGF